MDLYKSQTACRVCGITPRKLDYWVTMGVFQPSHVYKRSERRSFFLFSFEDLVRLKTICELREAGLSLAKIRAAMSEMDRRHPERQGKAQWLVSDGKAIYMRQDGTAIELLTGKRSGQLAFAAIALTGAVKHVEGKLRKLRPFESEHLEGSVGRFDAEVV